VVGARTAPKSRLIRLGALAVALVMASASLTPLTSAQTEESQPQVEVPARPAGLHVTTQEDSLSVGLDWEDVEGATGYQVRWRSAGPGNTLNEGLKTQTSEATIAVDDFGEWVVRVEACNEAGCGPPQAKRFEVEAAPEPEQDSTPEPEPEVETEPAEGSLAVAVVADPPDPTPGQRVTMTAQVTNAPEGLVPTFTWEMNVGGWFTVRTAPEFSYAGNRDEAWDYRVTVTYPNGDTAVSAPLTVAWLTTAARNAFTDNNDEITAQDNGDGVQGNQSTDYDSDDDGLIEVDSVAKLNAIRWDGDGDGTPTTANATDYAAAFPGAVSGMGCPSTGCTGYELTADIGLTGSWTAIPSITGTLDGNGNKITGLSASVGSGTAALIQNLNTGGVVEDLGIQSGSATGGSNTALAVGFNGGTVRRVWATGTVTGISAGASNVGGLVGQQFGGSIESSWSGVAVSVSGSSNRVGGLVGGALSGSVSDSYASGSVTATGTTTNVGGLAGQMGLGTRTASVTNSYSTASVSNSGGSNTGGLTGAQGSGATVTASYWDTTSSGQSTSAGGTAKTTSELQTPTSAAGIYSAWGTTNWDFGTASEYPVLKGLGATLGEQRGETTVSFSSSTYTVEEGSSVSVTVTLSAAPASAVTIPINHTPQGGASSADYSGVPTGVSFSTTETSKSFSFSATTDNTDETGESVKLTFGTLPSGVSAGSTTEATVTINDRTTPSTKVTLSVSPTSIDEEDGAQSVTITGTLDGAARTSATTVNLTFGDNGTAKIGSTKDYEVLPAGSGTNTITSGTITIAANQPSGSTAFRFRPVNDVIDEGTSETITITGSTTASDLTGGVQSVDLTLDDDDTLGTAISVDFTVGSRDEGDSPVQLRTRAYFDSGKARTSATTIALGYSTSTATSGSDYTTNPALPTSITIPAGQNSASSSQITVTIVDDKVHEPQEHIIMTGTLSGFTFTDGSLAIDDNDDAPNRVVLSFSPVSEGAGATTSTVTATLANSDGTKPQDVVLTQDVTVTLALGTGGTATSGTDYTALQSPLPTVTISAGQLSGTATISITPTADTIDDDGETIPFTATATTTQSGVTLTGVGANMVITEDVALITSLAGANDAGISNAFLAQPFTAGSAGSGPAVVSEVKIEFSNARSAVSVKIREDNGSNRPDMSADGLVATLTTTQSLSGTGVIAFTPMTGETIVLDGGSTYFVMIHEGSTVTPNSRKSVRLTNSAATGQTGWAMGTRLSRTSEGSGWGTPSSRVKMEVRGNVLPTPTVSFSSATYSATEGSTATVTVNLSVAPKRQVVIPISAANQNNASSSDYSGVPENLTFGADDTTKSFTFTAVDDSLDDDGESVGLSFGTLPSGVSAGTTSTATVSITDNDDTPDTINLTFDPATVAENAVGNVAVKVVATWAGTSTRTTATTVTLDSSLGGVTASGNYSASGLPSSVTIPAGQAKGEATGLSINPTDNSNSDGNRNITLGGTLAGFTVNDATMTITDDELPAITLTVLDSSDNAVSSISEAVTTDKSIKIKATAAQAVSADTEVTLTVAGTATGGGTDYTATFPTTVTISDTNTSAETAAFNIATVDDSISEGTETIIVSGSATGFNVNSATVNLVDNDLPVIDLTLDITTAAESAANQRVRVTATRPASANSDQVQLTVSAQAASTAERGTGKDYTGSSGATIVLPAGANSGSGFFNIDPLQDLLVEGSETIVLGSTVSGFTVDSATFTITDDDDPPDRVTLSFGSVGESAGATTSTITAKLANSDSNKDQDIVLTHDVVVRLTETSNGTATSGTDYTALATPLPTVTISSGSNSATATLNITPTSDTLDEGTGETISFTATAACKTAADPCPTDDQITSLTVPAATLTINDDDATPNTINLSFEPNSIAENAAGDGSGDVAVKVVATLAGNSTRTVATTVQLATSLGGTAPSSRYTSSGLPTSVTIPAGQSKGEATGLKINPTDNSVSDGSKTITLAEHGTNTLSGFTVNAATMNLVDDEKPEITLSLNKSSAGEDAASTSVTVTATRVVGVNSNPVSVSVTVGATGSTATRTSDYTGSSTATISIPANTASRTATISIDPVDDRLVEGAETVVIGGSATGFNVNSATFTINDNDNTSTGITLSVNPTSIDENAPGDANGDVSVTVTAAVNDGAPAANTTVTLSVSGTSTATSITDYSASSALTDTTADITIAAGQVSGSATIKIDPVDDDIDEGNGETIVIGDSDGTSAGGLAVAVSTATLTINDDDTASTIIDLSVDPASIAEDVEGDSNGDVSVTVTATLRGNKTHDTATTVTLSRGGTAVAADYDLTGFPASVTIAAGSSTGTATFKIDPVDDALKEIGGETLIITGTAAGFNVNSATMALVDDDLPVITLSVARTPGQSSKPASSLAEGETNAGFVITATRAESGLTTHGVTVQLAVEEADSANATAGDPDEAGCTGDYEARSGQLPSSIRIPADDDDNERIVRINSCQDRLVEGTENIVIGGTATGFEVTPVTITITDDDNTSTGIALTVTPTTLDEADGSTQVTVKAAVNDGAVTADTTVTLALTGTTVSADYTAPAALSDNNADITIPANGTEAQATFNIDPAGDNIDENDETIIFGASGGNSAGGLVVAVSTATVTITDDDTASTEINLSVNPNSIDENVAGDSNGDVSVTVTATLTGTATRTSATTVALTQTGSSSHYDLTSFPSSITIPAEQSSASLTFKIDPVDNTISEGDQTITISGSLTNFTVNSTTITLVDDEAPVITLSLPNTAAAGEAAGSTSVTVRASRITSINDDATTVTVTVGASGDGAQRDTDYTGTATATITIPSGVAARTTTISIDPQEDRLVEGTETITVSGSATGFSVTSTSFSINDNDNASTSIELSVSPTSLAESAASTQVTVTARVNDGAVAGATVVGLSLGSASSATPDADYAALTLGSITIDADQTEASATFNIAPVDDDIDEGAGESILFAGTKTSGDASITTVGSATFTITDDDTASTVIDLTADPGRLDEIAEGDANGDVEVTITATLTGDKTRKGDTVVTLGSALGGTAEGSRYTHTALPAIITIPDGQPSGTATFKINPDDNTTQEGNKTIEVSGSSLGFTVNPAVINLLDDDLPSDTVTLTLHAAATVAEADTAAAARVTVTAALNAAVRDTDTVVTLTFDGESTAERGADYTVTPSPTEIVIPADMLSHSIQVVITAVDDTIDEEATETIVVGGATTARVRGSSRRITVTPASDTITVTDNDTVSDTISLSVDPAGVNEKDGRAVPVTVTATLGDDTVRVVDTTVTLALAGSAAAGDDYSHSPATLPEITIPAGQRSGAETIRITPRQDDDAANETITVGGAAEGFATVSPATITITDDDSPSTSLTLTVNRPTIREGAANATAVTVTATLDGGTRGSDTTVGILLSGTASINADYTVAEQGQPSITIAADETSGKTTITITPNDDEIDEGDAETITVGGTAGGLTVSPATIAITDDDTASRITLTANRSGIEEDAGAAVGVTVTATLDVARSQDTTVSLRLAGSATGNGVDYTASTLPSITIAAGETTATATAFNITPIADDDHEGHETIDILGASEGIAVSGVTVSLLDQDTTPPSAGATELVARRAGGNSVRLTWTAPEIPEPEATDRPITGYRVQRRSDGGDWENAPDIVAANATSYVDRGLEYSTTYTFRVFALNADGPGPASNEATATTGARSRGGFGGGGGGGAGAPAPDPEPTAPSVPVPLPPGEVPELEDVSPTSVLAGAVQRAVSLGIVTPVTTPVTDPVTDGEDAGSTVPRFEPRREVTRGEVATPLTRLWHALGQTCPETAGTPFQDVPAGQTRADVTCLYAVGVTAGTTAATFSPDQVVTRAQMASLLVRIWRLTGRECPADPGMPFEDVATGNVHRDHIACLRALGITAGTTDTTFSPYQPVTRAQIAALVVRLYDAARQDDETRPDGTAGIP